MKERDRGRGDTISHSLHISLYTLSGQHGLGQTHLQNKRTVDSQCWMTTTSKMFDDGQLIPGMIFFASKMIFQVTEFAYSFCSQHIVLETAYVTYFTMPNPKFPVFERNKIFKLVSFYMFLWMRTSSYKPETTISSNTIPLQIVRLVFHFTTMMTDKTLKYVVKTILGQNLYLFSTKCQTMWLRWSLRARLSL